MYANKNNDMAVSPIVATLVLIVVAVIGAVAVGTIMGTFSTDVSKQANSGNAASQAQTEILIAGSTTVYPASAKLATDFQNQHPGIKITVQQGGSGAGVTSAALGIADIGASSSLKTITDAQAANPSDLRYQNLQYTQIGGSAVVWVENTAGAAVSPAVGENPIVTATDLLAAYTAAVSGTGNIGAAIGNVTANTIMLQRSDVSGTEETASQFVGGAYGTAKNFDASGALAQNGNEGMLAKLQATGKTLGFLDWGYANGASGITILEVGTSTSAQTATATNIKNGLKDLTRGNAQDTTSGHLANYPLTLVRGLYYVTEGTPSSVVQSFIDYARTPTAAVNDINPAGMFGITEFA